MPVGPSLIALNQQPRASAALTSRSIDLAGAAWNSKRSRGDANDPDGASIKPFAESGRGSPTVSGPRCRSDRQPFWLPLHDRAEHVAQDGAADLRADGARHGGRGRAITTPVVDMRC